MRNTYIKKITLSGIFIALCFLGSLIKISGSIAFDSMPAFLAGLLIGPFWGGVIGILGHYLSAFTSGFPLTIPVHIVIGICMFITVFLFSISFKKMSKTNISKYVVYLVSTFVGIFFNSVFSTIAIEPIFKMPLAFMIGLIGLLALVGFLNILVAILVYDIIKNRVKL